MSECDVPFEKLGASAIWDSDRAELNPINSGYAWLPDCIEPFMQVIVGIWDIGAVFYKGVTGQDIK